MEAPARPGLIVWVKLRLVALIRCFKKTPVSDIAEGDEEDSPEIKPARSKKRLVIGGAIGLLVLLLAGIGIAIRPAAPPPQEQPDTRRDVATIASRPGEPAPAPEKPPSEIEALKKENAELHARIEALKKELPQQQSYVPPTRYTGGDVPSSSVSGEMMIGNKDPKATAMTLKEAIEAMNASSGDHAKKPAK
ncbi:MAG: coiled-coil domain-containing protein [Gallionellaceae bacterium]